VIPQGHFTVEPWAVREPKLDMELLGQTESIFALSNGHIGWRGNFEEGEPHQIAGAYLNAVYEEVPLRIAESVYGYPEAGQTIVNVTAGQIIRLLVDDEPFDVRYGKVHAHQRVLDLKGGVLERTVEWESPAHRTVRIRSTRFVSLVHRGLAAIRYEVEPVDGPVDLVAQSELVANVPITSRRENDPRTAEVVEDPFTAELSDSFKTGAVLVNCTKKSRLRVAAAMDHEVRGPRGMQADTFAGSDFARFTVATTVKAGQRLVIVKYVAYGWSSFRSVETMRDQVEAELASARTHKWDGLASAQRRFLADFWSRADIQLEGDDELQQAIRFSMFHVLQAGARAEQRAIPAKGLTGPGYDGHTFWDTECFVLPVLTYTWPVCVADVLRWRHSILDGARKRAKDLGLKGAAFPWRTIHGEEGSGYWPASVAAFHVNADIADAVLRYVSATGDRRFDREAGAEMLIETARLWASLGHHDRSGAFRIDGVTGPDEYSALHDNNVYTNLMAQQNLNGGADAAERHRDVAKRLKVSAGEIKAWRHAAASMYVPYEPELRIHKQASQFTDHEPWDFEQTRPEQYPLFLHFPYVDLYRKQVIKQADLVLALHLRGDAFTADEKRRDFAYYEPLTVRDSSLSACTQAVMAAEVGHLQLAHDYLGETALMDLRDLEHNVREGVHMAALAGAWLAVVHGFGCMRHHGDYLGFSPRLPPAIRKVTFRVTFLDRQIRVSFDHRRVTYTLERGRPIAFHHYDELIKVSRGKPVNRSLPPIEKLPEPEQPAGRAPARRVMEARPKELRPTSSPRSRRLPSAGRQPSRRRPSRRSPPRASVRRRRGPSPPSTRAG
jgi:alpha,alpha-trehalose phosphorylase